MLARVPGSFVSLSASWMTPEHANGIISGYTVRCRLPSRALGRDYNSSVTNVILRNLMAATEYVCSVRAYSRVGYGRSSELQSIMTPQHGE